jgi:nucleotide-binding universal stress UspA family protein
MWQRHGRNTQIKGQSLLIHIKAFSERPPSLCSKRYVMKSILVPIGGSQTDSSPFETALAAARLFSSHLQFLHVHIGAGEAAANVPHTEFAMGPALSGALERLQHDADTRSATAAQHFREFCARSSVEICDKPADGKRVTASWHEEFGDALNRIISHARHSDLVVVGRAKRPNGLTADIIEQLLVKSGRPVLISASSPPSPPHALADTVMVCWRETAEAVRALGAAMPFLADANRVVVTSVAERGQDAAKSVGDVIRHLSLHGIPAEGHVPMTNGVAIADALASAAQACRADLIVLGAYGHSPMREALFGGCTESFTRHADRPVLLMH